MKQERSPKLPTDVANALNKYFVNVGHNLAEKLPASDISFENYLDVIISPSHSFVIHPTSPEEVIEVSETFSSSLCEDPNRILPKLFKLCVKLLSAPLANLINEYFSVGHSSKCLKVAKDIPIFRYGDAEDLGNRPLVTALIAPLVAAYVPMYRQYIVHMRIIKLLQIVILILLANLYFWSDFDDFSCINTSFS